jgi:hypothetical protein
VIFSGFANANPRDSRVAEAEEIFRNPWSMFAMGFLLLKVRAGDSKNLQESPKERRDEYVFREIM